MTPQPDDAAVTAVSAAAVLDGAVLASYLASLAPEAFDRLLGRATAELPALAEGMRAAWQNRDLADVERHAHKLGGLAAIFGLDRLARVAHQLERGFRAMAADPDLPRFDDLATELASGLRALADWRAGHRSIR